MPSITDYEFFGYTPDGEIIRECKEEIPCPECGKGKLIPRGRVRRHIRKEDTGEKVWYRIPYGKCDHEECGCYRRFLPDFMVPHKHYEEQAITDSLDGVINKESLESESFEDGLLDYPMYTKPREYRGMKVPDVLLSGHHENINKWRKEESIKRTKERRPDLLEKR